MATQGPLKQYTLESAADFSTTGQYRFGTINSSGLIALTGSAARVDGIVQGNPDAANKAVGVGYNGISKLELGGTITAGGTIQSGASGVGVTGSTNANVVALESGVSGDIISVLIR